MYKRWVEIPPLVGTILVVVQQIQKHWESLMRSMQRAGDIVAWPVQLKPPAGWRWSVTDPDGC